jgi:hypothetical protein
MHPQWLTALQSIASHSPPLLTPLHQSDPDRYTPGDKSAENSAKGIFEKELSYNPILRSFLNISAGGDGGLGSIRYVYMYVYIYVYVFLYILYIYIYIYTFMCIYKYVYINIYLYIY